MTTSLFLIDPISHEVAAKYVENGKGPEFVEVLSRPMLSRLASIGITVPGGFADGKYQIFPSDARSLFARAFKEEYFVHGLQQKGYYWVKQENYTGPAGEIQKALQAVLAELNRAE